MEDSHELRVIERKLEKHRLSGEERKERERVREREGRKERVRIHRLGLKVLGPLFPRSKVCARVPLPHIFLPFSRLPFLFFFSFLSFSGKKRVEREEGIIMVHIK